MPLNITVYDELRLRQGGMPIGAMLTPSTPAQVVALGAQSTGITGPAMCVLIADEGQRISISKTPGYVAPAAAGIKLIANVERWQAIPNGGPYYINAVAG